MILLVADFFCLLQYLQAQYDELVPAPCKNYPDIFLLQFYTWYSSCACELWYSNGMKKVMFTDGRLKTCLIPIAGFLNHSVRHSFL